MACQCSVATTCLRHQDLQSSFVCQLEAGKANARDVAGIAAERAWPFAGMPALALDLALRSEDSICNDNTAAALPCLPVSDWRLQTPGVSCQGLLCSSQTRTQSSLHGRQVTLLSLTKDWHSTCHVATGIKLDLCGSPIPQMKASTAAVRG